MKTPETDNDPHPRSISAIVLAAGRSRRMGQPKQLLVLSAKDNVIQVVTRLIRPLVHRVVVVVGHVGGQVAANLADQDITLAINPDVDRGMLSSVQVGIRAVEDPCDGYLICLGDQPSLHAAVIDAVLHNAAGGAGIVIPTYDGRRGHPVFIHRRYRDEILALDPATTGLNAVTRSHDDDTVEVAWRDARILDDMDTPADYAREFKRAGLAD